MSGRSVIETLDLHNDYGEYHTESCASQNYGWLSPRISFSADFTGLSTGRLSPEKRKMLEDEAQAHQQQQLQLQNSPPSPTLSSTTSSTDFEFSLSSFNIPGGGGSPGFIVPADELFHQGRLLPGFISPLSSAAAREDAIGGDDISAESSTDAALLPEIPVGCPTSTIARHMSTEGPTAAGGPGPSSLGCVLGPSCLRTPRGPKWRELFGALRRVKSDSGRQRIPDESLLPPKTLQGRRRFFKQLFSSTGGQGEPPGSTGAGSSQCDLDRAGGPTPSSRRPSSEASSSTGLLSASQERSTSWDSSGTPATRASAVRSAHLRHKAVPSATSPEPPSGTQLHAQQTQPASSDGRGGTARDQKADSRGVKTGDQSSEGFTFNPTPGRARASGGGSSGSGGGRLISPIRGQSRGGALGRSPSGRVIVRGLDRVASGRTPASLQEQIRALRSREIRRSPDRSGYSSVRVTPVLNVPVCMGPVLRGATKAGKGRLSNFRSLLNFKSKLPTTMSTPMVTRVD